MRRLLFIVLAAGLVVAAPSAAVDRKAPRIVGAQMVDADKDGKADRVRLTYSERIRHTLDRSRFPFTVVGYRITRMNKARGKTLVVLLAELAAPDPTATPAIRYKRTTKQPVRDRAGNQARRQTFRGTKSFGLPPVPQPGGIDADGDGYLVGQDCNDSNAAINPGAADEPDMAFVDSNCDGIDGTEANAIFLSPLGDDANPGTKAAPKRTLGVAVDTAAAQGKDVYMTFGIYAEKLLVANGVGVYGGYGLDWARSLSNLTRITGAKVGGSTQGAFASGVAAPTTLQHLTLEPAPADPPGGSSYGLFALNSPGLVIERVVATGAPAADGGAGSTGSTGVTGGPGSPGGQGSCNGFAGGGGGVSGPRVGREGGEGGFGGQEDGTAARDGQAGAGSGGGPGGPHGGNGNPGEDGQDGFDGDTGTFMGDGAGGAEGTATVGGWQSAPGQSGLRGTDGFGGGGGGGGGAQTCAACDNGGGNGGGEGGDGGGGGSGGGGGQGGGGSFGIFLVNSSGVVIKDSVLTAMNGGKGGFGASGGQPGPGGEGGPGGNTCTGEVGEGGKGGHGGAGSRGGGGGGGAGGPSVALFRKNSTITKSGNVFSHGSAGAGGLAAGGPGSPGQAVDEFFGP